MRMSSFIPSPQHKPWPFVILARFVSVDAVICHDDVALLLCVPLKIELEVERTHMTNDNEKYTSVATLEMEN
jgi:hypothetical protein